MKNKNFIHHIIDNDNQDGKYDGRVYTRFPPEPNGYLHIGHAKAICLNFSIAEEYNGKCNLRFDDTNPIAEEKEYVESIKKDIIWLGFDWKDRIFFASDYFDDMYQYAISLINNNLAYVCDLTNEEIKDMRGTLTTFGKESPFRNRTIDENLKARKNISQPLGSGLPINLEGKVIVEIKYDNFFPDYLSEIFKTIPGGTREAISKLVRESIGSF